MKTNVLLTVAGVATICVASTVFGQPPREGRRAGGGEGMEGHEPLISRIVDNPKIAERLGLSDEQVDALRKESYSAREKEIKLRAELELAGLEQAKLLTSKEVDEDSLMQAVEKTGKIRTELAKLRVKQLLVIKETLSEEQLNQIRSAMRERRHQGNRIGGRKGGPNGMRSNGPPRGPGMEDSTPPPDEPWGSSE